MRAGILGMEPEALSMEGENLNIYDGSLDKEKFETGNYLIYQPQSAVFAGEDYEYEGIRAGEEVTVSFYNFETERYVDRTFTVLAVVGRKPDNYAGEIEAVTSFVIPNTTFCEIYGRQADEMVSSILINTSGKDEAAYQEELETM